MAKIEALTVDAANGSEPGKSAASRRRILDAAARTFREKGYAATTLNEIADAAGMRAASLYYHFDSKEELLNAVFDIGMRRVVEAVRTRVAALPPEAGVADKMRAAIGAHLEMLLEQGDYTSANIRIFGQVPKSVQRRQLPLREDYGMFWRGLLAEARDTGALREGVDVSLVRLLMMGALNWCTEWYDKKRGPVVAVVEQACGLLLHGVLEDSEVPPAPARRGRSPSLTRS